MTGLVSRIPRDAHVAAFAAGVAGPVTDATWKELVLESKVPVLVDFWAPWCGPCRMIAPLIDEIAQEYGSKIVAVRAEGRGTPYKRF
jgi:thioredoxin 1